MEVALKQVMIAHMFMFFCEWIEVGVPQVDVQLI